MRSLDEDLRRLAGPTRDPETVGKALAAHPSDGELIRFGRAVDLDIHQTLALVLKGQWEAFLRDRAARESGRTSQTERGRGKGLQRESVHSREFHLGSGRAGDGAGLFELFEAEGGYATRSGYDRESFESLAHHGVLLGLHLVAPDGPEVAAFAAAQRVERALLSEAPPAEREAYWRKHCQWRALEDEVGALLLELENQALENERVQQRWLATFGPAYLAILEGASRRDFLERCVRRKFEDPGLTREELARLEAEHRREEQREIARLRRRLARARSGDAKGPGGLPMDDGEFWGYEEECKKLLREIYRLTHPDRVGQHGFTEAQRELLTECYREAVACGNPAAVDDEEVALGMRSLESLRAILSKARKVWQSMGLAWNEDAAVHGANLVERIAWLDARIAELEEEGRDVKAELFVIAADPDVQEKRASMASPGVVERVTAAMADRASALANQVGELESRLEQLFRPRGHP
jgi:hypothetical protein